MGALLSPTADTTIEPRRPITLRGVLEWAVLVIFALLIWNNLTLRRQQAHAAAAAKAARAFAVHDSLGALPVVDLAGVPRTLAFPERTVIAIINPGCDSCRRLLAEIHPDSGVQVLSVAPLAETKALAQTTGLATVTHVVADPASGKADPRFLVYPQLFVVERGQVVRTCASLGECGSASLTAAAQGVR